MFFFFFDIINLDLRNFFLKLLKFDKLNPMAEYVEMYILALVFYRFIPLAASEIFF